jgi:ABC-type sugar transport system ATPase subunit
LVLNNSESGEQHALRMVNIQKSFGLVRALTNINLEVRRNEIVGLIGDNGAGKSTMVKILTGVFPPTSGEYTLPAAKSISAVITSKAPTRTASKPCIRINRWVKNRSCGGTSLLGGRS